MFSVADFENARLARRNEIELKQRLARRQRNSANSSYGLANNSSNNNNINNAGVYVASSNAGYSGFCGGLNGSGDYSTGDSQNSKCSSSSEVGTKISVNPKLSSSNQIFLQQDPLPADVFLERYSLPRVVRILYSSKSSNETLQSSSSHGSSTAASSNSSTGVKQPQSQSQSQQQVNEPGTNSSSSGGSCPQPGHDELFLLYRLVRHRIIYHGHNAKTQRKKWVLIPQEFPGESSEDLFLSLPLNRHLIS